jgi:DNA-binding transcriptional LysR family regulator
MRLNLRQIEVFRSIMVTHSISGAAKLLNVSQPAVSRLISHTEQRLGLMLFDRVKGRLYPTPEAKRLFLEVEQVYQDVQRVNDVAEELIEHRTGHLRIACSPSLGQALMPRAIQIFCQRFPDVHISLYTMVPDEMLQSLVDNQIELGLAYTSVTHPNLKVELLYQNRLVAVLRDSHPLSSRREIQLEDLLDQQLVGYFSDIPFGRLLRSMYESVGKPLPARIEVQQAHVACALAHAGVGIAIVDEQTVKGPRWPGLVAVPIMPDIHAPIHLYSPLYEPLSRPAQEFVSILDQLCF